MPDIFAKVLENDENLKKTGKKLEENVDGILETFSELMRNYCPKFIDRMLKRKLRELFGKLSVNSK